MWRFKTNYFADSSQIAEIMCSSLATTRMLILKQEYLAPRQLFQNLRALIRKKNIIKLFTLNPQLSKLYSYNLKLHLAEVLHCPSELDSGMHF